MGLACGPDSPPANDKAIDFQKKIWCCAVKKLFKINHENPKVRTFVIIFFACFAWNLISYAFTGSEVQSSRFTEKMNR